MPPGVSTESATLLPTAENGPDNDGRGQVGRLSRLGDRLTRLGPASIVSLFTGGIILVPIGVNGLTSGDLSLDQFLRFHWGYHLPLQVWLAVLGIAFGLLGYGYTEANNHFFDYWCTQWASEGQGLDYGRYLNSLPRAPVTYGFRGFPWLVTCRHLILILSAAMSVGYKFSLASTDLVTTVEIPREQVKLAIPKLSFTYGAPPWLSDDETERSILHNRIYGQGGGSQIDLASTYLAAVSDCSGLSWKAGVKGTVVLREVTLLAEKSENNSTDDLDPMPHRDPPGTRRVRTGSLDWPIKKNGSHEAAMVEYRLESTGRFEIRWGSAELWALNKSATIPTAGLMAFDIRYAVSLVERYIRDSQCSSLRSVDLLSRDEHAPKFKGGGKFLERCGHWADAILQDPDISFEHAIKLLLRLTMTYVVSASQSEIQLGHGPLGVEPFGQEVRDEMTVEQISPSPSNDTIVAFLEDDSGTIRCHFAAAIVFICLGLFSILVALWRVLVGPPQMTSWIGQHVYLAKVDTHQIPAQEMEELSSGYKPARGAVYRCKLKL